MCGSHRKGNGGGEGEGDGGTTGGGGRTRSTVKSVNCIFHHLWLAMSAISGYNLPAPSTTRPSYDPSDEDAVKDREVYLVLRTADRGSDPLPAIVA